MTCGNVSSAASPISQCITKLSERAALTVLRAGVIMRICLPLLFPLLIQCVLGFINPYPKLQQIPVTEDVGEPLILTPLIEEGKIKEARALSRVGPLKGDHGIKSFTGYFTVNKNFSSNLFFWFFPSQRSSKDPVLLWLQGGPGATSLFGLFTEHGPYFIARDSRQLKPRRYTWAKKHNLLYIDSPVGTGYSFTNGGYARNETCVGKDLYSALLQFFQLFPELQKNDFFVSGESYGGKYVPALSYTIHEKNKAAKLKINFQGMAIGNGLSDPENMLRYGDYLYQLGLIDSNTREIFHQQEDLVRKYIEQKQWKKADGIFEKLLAGDTYPNGSIFYNATGFTFYYNFLHSKQENKGGDLGTYIQSPEVRRAIHVGNATFHTDNKVEENLVEDVMQSVKPWIEELVEKYPVLIYNGQLDIIVAYPLTVSYLQKLEWSGATEYKTAPRYIWRVGDDIAGYVKHAGKLMEVLVRNAGHMVPTDQPKWALDLITRFTQKKKFY